MSELAGAPRAMHELDLGLANAFTERCMCGPSRAWKFQGCQCCDTRRQTLLCASVNQPLAGRHSLP